MTDFLRELLKKNKVDVARDIDQRPAILGSYFTGLPLVTIDTYIEACIQQRNKMHNDRNESAEAEKADYDHKISQMDRDIEELFRDYGVVARRLIKEGKLVTADQTCPAALGCPLELIGLTIFVG